MIQAESPLGHHLFQVPIAERISQIPTNAQHDDLVLKVSPPKQCWPLVLHSLTLPECIQPICDRAKLLAACAAHRFLVQVIATGAVGTEGNAVPVRRPSWEAVISRIEREPCGCTSDHLSQCCDRPQPRVSFLEFNMKQ